MWRSLRYRGRFMTLAHGLVRGALVPALLLIGTQAADAQLAGEAAERAAAEVRWQQRRPDLATLQWQPWTPWDRRSGFYEPREPRMWRRPSLRPYWQDRWARDWTYPGQANRQRRFGGVPRARQPYGADRERIVIDRPYGWRSQERRFDSYGRGAPW